MSEGDGHAILIMLNPAVNAQPIERSALSAFRPFSVPPFQLASAIGDAAHSGAWPRWRYTRARLAKNDRAAMPQARAKT